MKKRLDILMVDQGLVDSRSKAQELISAQKIAVKGQVITKASTKFEDMTQIDVLGLVHPWVSRGGMKLAGALEVFNLSVLGKVALDVGASTGGFTDVLLHHGAAHVYAVDVGQDQLVQSLKENPKVTSLEKTNARYVTADLFSPMFDFIVCDASFISLKLVLDRVIDLAPAQTKIVALIKPQFEVGKQNLGKGGIVKNTALHQEVCQDIQSWIEQEKGCVVNGVTESPILGPDGNKEFLLYAIKA